MSVNIPNEYLITVNGANWVAQYAGSGAEASQRFGFRPEQATEQYDVPEGKLMVAAPTSDRGFGACQLYTGDPEDTGERENLDSANYHFYQLKRLEY